MGLFIIGTSVRNHCPSTLHYIKLYVKKDENGYNMVSPILLGCIIYNIENNRFVTGMENSYLASRRNLSAHPIRSSDEPDNHSPSTSPTYYSIYPVTFVEMFLKYLVFEYFVFKY